MAIHWSVVSSMEGMQILPRKGAVLDVGSSNLYGAETQPILDFVQRFNPGAIRDETWAASLAQRSGYGKDGIALNEAFFGELLEKAGISYRSIDIAEGFRTTILDLNREALPDDFIEAFDLVINAGTTEHLINQANAFTVVHDATKVGGLMYHQLPAAGFAAHGYFCYTGRFFLDLASYNHYELVDFWFDGPVGADNLLDSVKDYVSYFPVLKRITQERSAPREARINSTLVPNMAINALFRKTRNAPFAGLLDVSTSVGTVGKGIFAAYAGGLGQRLMRKASRTVARVWPRLRS